jgi:hypothetical protein
VLECNQGTVFTGRNLTVFLLRSKRRIEVKLDFRVPVKGSRRGLMQIASTEDFSNWFE